MNLLDSYRTRQNHLLIANPFASSFHHHSHWTSCVANLQTLQIALYNHRRLYGKYPGFHPFHREHNNSNVSDATILDLNDKETCIELPQWSSWVQHLRVSSYPFLQKMLDSVHHLLNSSSKTHTSQESGEDVELDGLNIPITEEDLNASRPPRDGEYNYEPFYPEVLDTTDILNPTEAPPRWPSFPIAFGILSRKNQHKQHHRPMKAPSPPIVEKPQDPKPPAPRRYPVSKSSFDILQIMFKNEHSNTTVRWADFEHALKEMNLVVTNGHKVRRTDSLNPKQNRKIVLHDPHGPGKEIEQILLQAWGKRVERKLGLNRDSFYLKGSKQEGHGDVE